MRPKEAPRQTGSRFLPMCHYCLTPKNFILDSFPCVTTWFCLKFVMEKMGFQIDNLESLFLCQKENWKQRQSVGDFGRRLRAATSSPEFARRCGASTSTPNSTSTSTRDPGPRGLRVGLRVERGLSRVTSRFWAAYWAALEPYWAAIRLGLASFKAHFT